MNNNNDEDNHNDNNHNHFRTNHNLKQLHKSALHSLYTMIKHEFTELARLQLASVPPTALPHPFMHAPIDGNDMFTVNMVLWTAMHMASGIAGAINSGTESFNARGPSSGHMRAVFGPDYDPSTTFVSQDMVMAREADSCCFIFIIIIINSLKTRLRVCCWYCCC
jgi:hypothetical protein